MPEVNDPPRQAPGSRRTARQPRKGYVEFENVTFQYPGAEEPALSGVSFVAQPGEVTAIIGGTGSGKSTLAGLIPRFYDVNEGRVLVDGVDVRELRQEDLRARIGFVPQKAVLFSGTIAEQHPLRPRDGIGRRGPARGDGRAGRRIHRPRCRRATPRPSRRAARTCRAARSSGWRLRARWCGDAGIYVFDDSFSALDFATDARLRAALRTRDARRDGVHRVAAHRHGDERRPHHRAGRRPGRRHRHPRGAARRAARSIGRSRESQASLEEVA